MSSKGIEPAFPSGNEFRVGPIMTSGHAGMTKREMMAMHLAQGLLAANATYGGKTDARNLLAADAVAHADALLAELERTCQKP